MFKLKLKDDVEVSTIEELRDNFDLEKTVEYFQNGELLTWLEDRFYDDEADAISEIKPGDDNFAAKICAALNVEYTDLEFVRRVREKKNFLANKTDDAEIIDNAVATALNQEDLGALIQMDYKTIYLCGEQFNVPIRIADRKYIGILGTPKIKIRAQSQEDLDAKNIVFENCKLPYAKETPIEGLRALAEKIFQTGGRWPLVKDGHPIARKTSSFVSSNEYGGYFGDIPISDELKAAILKAQSDEKKGTAISFDGLSKAEKAAALRMFAQGKYTENQIAYMQLTKDFSSGFAMTIDSFCTAGTVSYNVIPYSEIEQASCHGDEGFDEGLTIKSKDTFIFFCCYNKSVYNPYTSSYEHPYNGQACVKLFGTRGSKIYSKIVNFLEVAKNF